MTHLQLPPELALVTPHAVHDPGDVPEVLPELGLELGRRPAEHDGLVKVLGEGADQVEQLLHRDLGILVLLGLARVEALLLEVGSDLKSLFILSLQAADCRIENH